MSANNSNGSLEERRRIAAHDRVALCNYLKQQHNSNKEHGRVYLQSKNGYMSEGDKRLDRKMVIAEQQLAEMCP